mgnify:CR=1 FL=1
MMMMMMIIDVVFDVDDYDVDNYPINKIFRF